MPASAMSVGEVAAVTGLSVRMLRHWERLSLLASSRTATGHRRYDPDDLVRVVQAVTRTSPSTSRPARRH